MSPLPPSDDVRLHLSKHRLEALVDGIFAVAMTLLVIELKVSDHAAAEGADGLARSVLQLTPKFIAG